MFGLGFSEILLILAVALIVFGPKKLPEAARLLGKAMGEFRRTLDEIRYDLPERSAFAEETPQKAILHAEKSSEAGSLDESPEDGTPDK